MYDTDNLVLIVHAIDTEGPLRESLAATFERLEYLFGVKGLPRTQNTLRLLREQKIPLHGKETDVAALLGSHSLGYKRSWKEIDEMLSRIMDKKFRRGFPDSYGGGWVYNWHCLDHVGFKTNERGRDLGYHRVFDHYKALLQKQKNCPDALHYHFHYISTYRDAHRCATSFLNSAPEFLEVLCRKVIERHWFPKAARAGFQTERPDSHWFLEQWVPYDLTNMAQDDNKILEHFTDFRKGRSGNWRRAPADWSVYHPSHDDYQIPGACRRWIGRALNPLNRVGLLTKREVEKAFQRANKGLPTLLGLAGHDFRELEDEVEYICSLIRAVAPRYPKVKFKYAEEVEAFRRITGAPYPMKDPLKLKVMLHRAPKHDMPNLVIKTICGHVFGPQPFLAIETRTGRFIHDNLDFGEKEGIWHFAFHSDTLPLKDVRRIGVAANDAYANTSLTVLTV